MPAQMILGVQLPQNATFTAFVGHTNAEARAAVERIVAGAGERLFLYGPAASGKTHLLQAACRAADAANRRSVYVPLAQLGGQVAALLDGLHDMDCVCVDEVEAIAGDRSAEIALLGLSDALRATRAGLIAAGTNPPGELGLDLPDLATRLNWGGTMALNGLDDDDKFTLLIQRADQRGMRLPPATARWLLRHGERDVGVLMAYLDTLDAASLAAHRRLTIPFVKQALVEAGFVSGAPG